MKSNWEQATEQVNVCSLNSNDCIQITSDFTVAMGIETSEPQILPNKLGSS
jgi:hypothetical protein